MAAGAAPNAGAACWAPKGLPNEAAGGVAAAWLAAANAKPPGVLPAAPKPPKDGAGAAAGVLAAPNAKGAAGAEEPKPVGAPCCSGAGVLPNSPWPAGAGLAPNIVLVGPAGVDAAAGVAPNVKVGVED